MSTLLKTNKDKAILEIVKIAKLGTLLYVIVLICLFYFSEEIIYFVYGKNMEIVNNIFQVLLIIPLTIFLNNMFGTQILLNMGHDKQFFYIVLYTAIINLVLVGPLTYIYSFYGTAFSVVVSEIFLMFGMYYYAIDEISSSRKDT